MWRRADSAERLLTPSLGSADSGGYVHHADSARVDQLRATRRRLAGFDLRTCKELEHSSAHRAGATSAAQERSYAHVDADARHRTEAHRVKQGSLEMRQQLHDIETKSNIAQMQRLDPAQIREYRTPPSSKFTIPQTSQPEDSVKPMKSKPSMLGIVRQTLVRARAREYAS